MLSSPVSLPRPRHIEDGSLTCGDYGRHPGEPPALTFHYIFHYISHPFSWWQLVPWLLRRGDTLRRAHLISSHTRTCMHVCTHSHKHTLNTLLPALVNPRLPLPVYKSKGHGVGGGQRGGCLWQLWHSILICCYLASGMHPRLHPGQIWLVERTNRFHCYKQLGCNIPLSKPNVKALFALNAPCYNIARITLQIKFKPRCVFCFLVKAVMLSTLLDPDRVLSPACWLAP